MRKATRAQSHYTEARMHCHDEEGGGGLPSVRRAFVPAAPERQLKQGSRVLQLDPRYQPPPPNPLATPKKKRRMMMALLQLQHLLF